MRLTYGYSLAFVLVSEDGSQDYTSGPVPGSHGFLCRIRSCIRPQEADTAGVIYHSVWSRHKWLERRYGMGFRRRERTVCELGPLAETHSLMPSTVMHTVVSTPPFILPKRFPSLARTYPKPCEFHGAGSWWLSVDAV